MIEIVCDACGEAESEWGTTATSFRKSLQDYGWKSTSNTDLCPHCIKEAGK